MNLDESKIDNATLALLYLNQVKSGYAWKQFPWDATDRLYAAGMISDPHRKNKSVSLTDEGESKAKELLAQIFGDL